MNSAQPKKAEADPRSMIPVARPLLGEREAAAACRAILSGWVSQGPEVSAFEDDFARLVGAGHACAVSNCTTALHLALLACDVGPEDEVITVSHSFIAGGNVIRQCGAVPVFVDIEEGGFNIDPAAVAAAITCKTRAIMTVHQIGMPCDMTALMAVAHAHGIPVIEDAACAIGSKIRFGDNWRDIGNPIGDIACFSFHPRKVLTTGEGGMLTTNRADLDDRFRLWRQHGMSLPDTVRHSSPRVLFESYPERGYNYRMTDIQAAIGRVQLARLPEVIARRRELAAAYGARLATIPGVTPPSEPDWARSNWQSYAVRLAPEFNQRYVMQALLDDGIATRRGIMCMHMEGAMSDLPLRYALPRSEAARNHTILLPLFAQMTEDELNRVVAAISSAIARPQAAA